MSAMRVEIWSDIVCPWCYIGKRRLEHALEQFDGEVELVWRSFELDPRDRPPSDKPINEVIARKYGLSLERADAMISRIVELAAAEGIEFKLGRSSSSNTFDAHRLLQLAKASGVGPQMKERLLSAYFCDGRDLGDDATLLEAAAAVGLDGERAKATLASSEFAEAVRGDELEAQQLGVTGVPFFLFEGYYPVPGAQSVETMLHVLQAVQKKLDEAAPAGESCDVEGC